VIYFVDASALVKLYHEEIGTAVMQELLDDPDRIARFYISDHVGLEVVVRLNKVRRSLPRSERRRMRSAIASFDERSRAPSERPPRGARPGSFHGIAGQQLCRFRRRNAGHDPSRFRLAGAADGEQLVFVVSDRKLKYVATRAGFPTFDPEREQAEHLGH
jgi:hypothetical protein